MRKPAARRRATTILTVLMAAAAAATGLMSALRPGAPAVLEVLHPERVAAHEPFELNLRADRPVAWTVRHPGGQQRAEGESVTVALTVPAGAHVIRIDATDDAGRSARTVTQAQGIAVADLSANVPSQVVAGAAFTVRLRSAPPNAPVTQWEAYLDGDALPLHAGPAGPFALAAAPLTTEAGESHLKVLWRDGLQREAMLTRRIARAAYPKEPETLQLAPEVLAAATPAARERQNEDLEAARVDPTRAPRWSDAFLLPIAGRTSSGFGDPRRYAPGGPVSFHLGLDIAAPTGTEIRATNDGVVTIAAFYPIAGGMTVLDHGAGVTSRYYHQSRILVQSGQIVRRGDVIGEVGSTGLSTGPHLHWEMRIDEVPSDPLGWVGRTLP